MKPKHEIFFVSLTQETLGSEDLFLQVNLGSSKAILLFHIFHIGFTEEQKFEIID
jgi:hypothetical protein